MSICDADQREPGCGALFADEADMPVMDDGSRLVAELAVYMDAPGTVVRCRSCDNVLMVFVKIHDRTCVDLMGLAALGA